MYSWISFPRSHPRGYVPGIHFESPGYSSEDVGFNGLVWQEFIRALELALHETSSPLSVAEECMRQRENRTGVDRVQDEVELALIKVG